MTTTNRRETLKLLGAGVLGSGVWSQSHPNQVPAILDDDIENNEFTFAAVFEYVSRGRMRRGKARDFVPEPSERVGIYAYDTEWDVRYRMAVEWLFIRRPDSNEWTVQQVKQNQLDIEGSGRQQAYAYCKHKDREGHEHQTTGWLPYEQPPRLETFETRFGVPNISNVVPDLRAFTVQDDPEVIELWVYPGTFVMDLPTTTLCGPEFAGGKAPMFVIGPDSAPDSAFDCMKAHGNPIDFDQANLFLPENQILLRSFFLGKFPLDDLMSDSVFPAEVTYTCADAPMELGTIGIYDYDFTVSLKLTKENKIEDKPGLLGDVVSVDLDESFDEVYRDVKPLASNWWDSELHPPNHQCPATKVGYVAKVEDWEAILELGEFYFVPVKTGRGLLDFTAWNEQDEPVTLSLFVEISDDPPRRAYSRQGADDAVTFDGDRLSVYRQQRRLSYLGFVGFDGDPVVADGRKGGNTMWAVGLFNHAVSEEPPNSGGQFAMNEFTDAGKQFLNAKNAPRWENLFGSLILGLEFETGSETWGTDWTREFLARSVITDLSTVKPLIITRISGGIGGFSGGTPRSEIVHEAGMDVDIRPVDRLSYDRPFYRTHTLGRRRGRRRRKGGGGRKQYVAARGPRDPRGRRHVLVENPPGSGNYEARRFRRNRAPRNAVPHDRSKLDDLEFLASVADLLVDNVDIGYDIGEVISLIFEFQTDKVTRVDPIYFNDPRTWEPGDIQGKEGYADTIHVTVLPPDPTFETQSAETPPPKVDAEGADHPTDDVPGGRP